MSVLAVMGKICSVCKEYKDSSEYYVHSRKSNGNPQLMARCKPCDKTYKKNRYHTNTKYRDSVLRNRKNLNTMRVFRITAEEYDKYFIDANCSICERTDDLVLDHCHNSGRIRGVLCRNCNVGIGQLKDSSELVARALYYLQENE